MIEIPIRVIAEALGAGGVVATMLGSVKQWFSPPSARRNVTVSTSDGQSVVLDVDVIRGKSPEELQALIESLIPPEANGRTDSDMPTVGEKGAPPSDDLAP